MMPAEITAGVKSGRLKEQRADVATYARRQAEHKGILG